VVDLMRCHYLECMDYLTHPDQLVKHGVFAVSVVYPEHRPALRSEPQVAACLPSAVGDDVSGDGLCGALTTLFALSEMRS
jgi:hypothetical protein